MVSTRLSWILPVLLLSSGCIRGGGAALFGMGMMTGAAVAMSERGYLEEVVVVQQPPVLLAVPVEAAAPPPPPPRRFDPTAAKASLEHVDFGACRPLGVPRGYLHARATFGNAGNSTEVLVDSPAGLSPEAVACVGRSIGGATVPPFDGDGSVTVGASWFIP